MSELIDMANALVKCHLICHVALVVAATSTTPPVETLYFRPLRNGTIDSFRRLCDTHLSDDDRRAFWLATGSDVQDILEHKYWTSREGAKTAQALMSNEKAVPHELNALGLHALRALLAERVTTDVADRAWARGPRLPNHPDVRRRHGTLFQQLRNEGVVAIELSEQARQIFPKVDEEVASLLYRTSGYSSISHSYTTISTLTFSQYDSQFYMHVDTYQPTWKVFVFFGGTSPASGPFHYVKGTHSHNVWKLKWLYERTRSLKKEEHLMNSITTSPKLAGVGCGYGSMRPFVDHALGLCSSIRYLGYSPRAGSEWFGQQNMAQPTAFTVDGTSQNISVVIADTSGFHFRGYAPQGAKRTSARLAESGGGCGGCIARKNPFYCRLEASPEPPDWWNRGATVTKTIAC